MPITRKLVAQDNDECQILGMNAVQRYIVNKSDDWQFLFGPHSSPGAVSPVIKIAAEFDADNLDNVRFVAYLYDPVTGSIRSAATCSFTVSLVSTPNWSETIVSTAVGSVLPNSYFFTTINLASLAPAVLDGAATLMVEATATRLSKTFRDRVYINHLGVYDSIIRLRHDVEYLDITKLDE